jgi:hypothetical protein
MCVMTLVSFDDDLDWEFAFDSHFGHPAGLAYAQRLDGKRMPSKILRETGWPLISAGWNIQ